MGSAGSFMDLMATMRQSMDDINHMEKKNIISEKQAKQARKAVMKEFNDKKALVLSKRKAVLAPGGGAPALPGGGDDDDPPPEGKKDWPCGKKTNSTVWSLGTTNPSHRVLHPSRPRLKPAPCTQALATTVRPRLTAPRSPGARVLASVATMTGSSAAASSDAGDINDIEPDTP